MCVVCRRPVSSGAPHQGCASYLASPAWRLLSDAPPARPALPPLPAGPTARDRVRLRYESGAIAADFDVGAWGWPTLRWYLTCCALLARRCGRSPWSPTVLWATLRGLPLRRDARRVARAPAVRWLLALVVALYGCTYLR